MERLSMISDEEIVQALRESSGLIYLAGRKLNCYGSLLYIRIQKTPRLLEVKKEIDEILVDIAEQRLYELIGKKSFPALMLFLKTKGRHRGYAEKEETQISPEVMQSFTTLMTSIDKMQKGD